MSRVYLIKSLNICIRNKYMCIHASSIKNYEIIYHQVIESQESTLMPRRAKPWSPHMSQKQLVSLFFSFFVSFVPDRPNETPKWEKKFFFDTCIDIYIDLHQPRLRRHSKTSPFKSQRHVYFLIFCLLFVSIKIFSSLI